MPKCPTYASKLPSFHLDKTVILHKTRHEAKWNLLSIIVTHLTRSCTRDITLWQKYSPQDSAASSSVFDRTHRNAVVRHSQYFAGNKALVSISIITSSKMGIWKWIPDPYDKTSTQQFTLCKRWSEREREREICSEKDAKLWAKTHLKSKLLLQAGRAGSERAATRQRCNPSLRGTQFPFPAEHEVLYAYDGQRDTYTASTCNATYMLALLLILRCTVHPWWGLHRERKTKRAMFSFTRN